MTAAAKACHSEPVETAAGRLSPDGKSRSLPAGWSWKTIPDLTGEDGVFIDGDWVESKDQDPNGDVRLIQLADVGDGVYRDKSERFLTNAKASELGCTFLKSGDVLVARMPDPLGRACIFPGDSKPAVTVVDVCIVRSGKGQFDHRWLSWFVNAHPFRAAVAGLQAGSTRKRISRGNLATIPLPVPPLPEQRRIVAEIEKQFTRLEAGVAALRRVQANLHRYRAAVLKAACEGRLVPTEATGWRDATFGEVCRVQCGFAFKSTDYQQSGVPLVRIASLVDGEVAVDGKTAYLPASYVDEYAAFALKKGDVLIAMSGATTGKMATFNLDTPALLNQRVGRFQIKPGNLCNARFMALIVEQIKQQVIRDAYGAAQPNISPKQIESMPFRLPPLAEQERIVAEAERRLSVVEELSALVTANLQRATRLRQSILQRAFEGKL